MALLGHADLIPADTATAAARPSVARRVINAVAGVMRAVRNRRAFAQLCAMSDVELADIGLTRADLGVAGDLSLVSDPTTQLGRIVRQRVSRGVRLG